MLISKKDLLAETGISYGQLYRWKRERLIPEEWFIKQSSYTGQETFFPKEQIINRIQSIQELKDKYSLEELAKILSPEVADTGFTMEDLQLIDEISNEMLHTFQSILNKDNFSFIEVLLMVISSKVMKEYSLTLYQIGDLLQWMTSFVSAMKSTGYIIVIYMKDQDYYSVIYQEQSKVFVDERLKLVKQFRMDEVSNQMKIKYRNIFDFHLDDMKQTQGENFNTYGNNGSAGAEPTTHENSNNEESKSDKDNNKKKHKGKEKDKAKKNDDDNSEIVLKFNNWEVRL